jgi:type I restriction enzyme S subunit
VSLVGTIGVTVQVRDPRPFCFQRHIGLLRPNRSVLPEFLSCMVQSRGFIDQALESATGSAQLTVPLKALRGMGFLLPPIAEQREIVRRVEALFKLAAAIERRVAAATVRAEKLTQAILAKAFRGELVPIEADLAGREGRGYETAERLLDRVKQETGEGARSGRAPRTSSRGAER